MNPRAKFCANTCNSKRVMGDKQNSEWRPSPPWIYYYCQFWLHSYFLQWLATLLQNYVNLTQTAADLLVFVQKSKMAATAILNYYFVTLDRPRSPFVVLNLPFQFCIDRVYTFRYIMIW